MRLTKPILSISLLSKNSCTHCFGINILVRKRWWYFTGNFSRAKPINSSVMFSAITDACLSSNSVLFRTTSQTSFGQFLFKVSDETTSASASFASSSKVFFGVISFIATFLRTQASVSLDIFSRVSGDAHLVASSRTADCLSVTRISKADFSKLGSEKRLIFSYSSLEFCAK